MSGRRPERIAEQLREELSQIISGEMKDPRVGLVTVTGVKLSPDLRDARVYVGGLGPDEEIEQSLEALRSAAGFIRWRLGRSLQLRHTPQLHFVFDRTVRTAARIEEILDEEASRLRERQGELSPAATESGPSAMDESSQE
jgi:ribosome-binding factor A